MRHYKIVNHPVEELESITCDRCKRTFNFPEEELEIQEFHSINFIGGFSSAFGDGSHIKADFCSSCLKFILPYCCIDGIDSEGNDCG